MTNWLRFMGLFPFLGYLSANKAERKDAPKTAIRLNEYTSKKQRGKDDIMRGDP